MDNKKIGVIGIPGKWSTEVLADAVEAKTGFRLVIDMADVAADVSAGTLWANGENLCALDGLIVHLAGEDPVAEVALDGEDFSEEAVENGTTERQMRNQFDAWRKFMTATMRHSALGTPEAAE